MVLFNKGCCCVSLQRFVLGVGWLGCIQSVFACLRVILTFIDKTHEHYGFVALKLILSVLHFYVCLELIRGAQNSNRKLVIPWLVYNVIALILANIFFVSYIMFVVFVMDTGEPQKELIATTCFLMFLIDIWWIYVWLCIYSFYQEQKMQENMYDKNINLKLPLPA